MLVESKPEIMEVRQMEGGFGRGDMGCASRFIVKGRDRLRGTLCYRFVWQSMAPDLPKQ